MLVQKLRLRRGWSQEQLADVSGLSVRTIQRIERGQKPSLESQKALAAVFEVDLSHIQSPDQEAEMHGPASSAHEAQEALAFARVRRIKRLYAHLFVYVVVIGALSVVNLVGHPRVFWVIWPALGWGVGLAFHGLSAFNRIPFLNAEWEKRQVEKVLGRPL